MKVLLLEDDQAIANAILDHLGSSSFQITHAATLAQAESIAEGSTFTAYVLDVLLPDGNGLEWAGRLRAKGVEDPILMLTAQDSIQDRVAGLRGGADDYLCKPFAMDELVARLDALFRRVNRSNRHLYSYSDVQVDVLTRTVRRGQEEAKLSVKELDLLVYLVRHAEKIVTREELYEQVWGDTQDQGTVLNVYMNYLRNKIEKSRFPRLIHTIRGVGFMMSTVEPDELLRRP